MAAGDTPKSTLEELRDALPFSVPQWLFNVVLIVLLIGVLLPGLMNYSPILRFCKRILSRKPGKRDARRRVLRRALFADHVESQMRRLGEKEEWRDSRYAELEAELEIVGTRESGLFSMLRRRSTNALRRVPSLSIALEKNTERIILLEGEPGAGKSVAMRHLAQRMARAARHGVGTIPIYVNLKTFIPIGDTPSSDEVREFVLRSINQVRDRDIERFLEAEFEPGLEAGTWLFLFDSFDEIPAILSATEADAVIVAYADALHGFLHGMNQCRGVVASREFRGPGRQAWPTFRVVPLSQKRKVDLIEKTDLQPEVEQALLADLPTAESSVQQMSDNPLFLSLLCEHMREGNEFPSNVHAVLETYVSHRLVRDADLVQGYFDTTYEDVRVVAEELAFIMASSLGLTVPKSKAVELVAASLQRDPTEVDQAIEALKYTKLARTGDDESTVTFSHRRLQEYFATCVVIRDPDRVPVRSLLTDGRWRETAVTILQTQDPAALLAEALLQLPEPADGHFSWPSGALYLFGILAEGCTPAVLAQSAPEIPRRVSVILRRAWAEGQRYDQKWALESCSAADRDTSLDLVKHGFASDSEWLRQESFAQVRKVPEIVADVADEVCQTLLNMASSGKLRRDRASVLSQIRRLPEPARFVSAYRILLVSPILHAFLVLLFLSWRMIGDTGLSVIDLAVSTVAIFYVGAPFYMIRIGLTSMLGVRRKFPSDSSQAPPLSLLVFMSYIIFVLATTFLSVETLLSGDIGSGLAVTLVSGALLLCTTSSVAVRSGLTGSLIRDTIALLSAPLAVLMRIARLVVRSVRRARIFHFVVFGCIVAFVYLIPMISEKISSWTGSGVFVGVIFGAIMLLPSITVIRSSVCILVDRSALRRKLGELPNGTDPTALGISLRVFVARVWSSCS